MMARTVCRRRRYGWVFSTTEGTGANAVCWGVKPLSQPPDAPYGYSIAMLGASIVEGSRTPKRMLVWYAGPEE